MNRSILLLTGGMALLALPMIVGHMALGGYNISRFDTPRGLSLISDAYASGGAANWQPGDVSAECTEIHHCPSAAQTLAQREAILRDAQHQGCGHSPQELDAATPDQLRQITDDNISCCAQYSTVCPDDVIFWQFTGCQNTCGQGLVSTLLLP